MTIGLPALAVQIRSFIFHPEGICVKRYISSDCMLQSENRWTRQG